MVWYSHLFQNFPQFIVIHTVKALGAKAEDMGKACPGKAPRVQLGYKSLMKRDP